MNKYHLAITVSFVFVMQLSFVRHNMLKLRLWWHKSRNRRYFIGHIYVIYGEICSLHLTRRLPKIFIGAFGRFLMIVEETRAPGRNPCRYGQNMQTGKIPKFQVFNPGSSCCHQRSTKMKLCQNHSFFLLCQINMLNTSDEHQREHENRRFLQPLAMKCRAQKCICVRLRVRAQTGLYTRMYFLQLCTCSVTLRPCSASYSQSRKMKSLLVQVFFFF